MAIYNGYKGAKTCTSGPTSGARGLMSWFLAKFADDGGLNAGIYNCRDIRGGSTTSLHGEGRAADLAIRPYSAKYGTHLADLLRRYSKELGIQCVIWNRKIWSGLYDEFRPYTGSNAHVDHLHVELSWASANMSQSAMVALLEKTLGHLVDDDSKVEETKPVATPSKNTGGSVVDWLNSKGRGSSFADRAKLAAAYGIKSYKGTADQNGTLLSKLKAGSAKPAPKPVAKPRPVVQGYNGDSIIDWLNAKGRPSKFADRAKLAKSYGVKNYTGTASQNTLLLNKIKKGTAAKQAVAHKVTGSVVNYLVSKGQNSSFTARAEMAREFGIKNYSGTAAQNNTLLSKLQD